MAPQASMFPWQQLHCNRGVAAFSFQPFPRCYKQDKLVGDWMRVSECKSEITTGVQLLWTVAVRSWYLRLGTVRDLAATFWEHNFLYGLLHVYRCHQHSDVDTHQVFWAYYLCILVYTVRYGGQDRTLWHPCLYIPLRRHFTFDWDSELSLRKKRANELDYTDQKF
jgi:hypothetical protein